MKINTQQKISNSAFPRLLSLCAAALFLLLFVSAPLSAVKKEITVAAVGDCIITHKISVLKDPALLKLVDLLRRADCAYGNCEMTLFDPREGFPPWKNYQDCNTFCEPWGADELAWVGIDIMSLPNNHTLDFDYAGLFSTMRNLERVGIAYSGAGEDLEYAAKPGYVDTAGGVVSLVSSCSSIAEKYAPASLSHPHMKGRPGLNPLKVDYSVQVDEKTFAGIYDVKTDLLSALLGTPVEKEPIENIDTLHYGGNNRFVKIKAGKPAVMLSTRQEDRQRVFAAIKIAKNNSRVVIASNHEHNGDYREKTPVRYGAEFARMCIDAGADMYVNTGPHRLWGLEIYKGKPIFHSLGNFFFQWMRLIAPEVYRKSGLPPDCRDPYESESKLAGYFRDDEAWESVVPFVKFDNGNKLKEIVLYPIELEKDAPLHQVGMPRLAEGMKAASILEKFKESSRRYGTRMEYKKGVGRVIIE